MRIYTCNVYIYMYRLYKFTHTQYTHIYMHLCLIYM